MTSMLFEHSTLITVAGADAVMDADAVAGLPAAGAYIDLAVIGYANFLTGTYKQLSATDVEDIETTVTVDSAKVRAATFALLETVPASSSAALTTYGTAVIGTKDKLVIQSKATILSEAVTDVSPADSSQHYFANLQVWQGDNTNVLDTGRVKHSQGIGAVLVQAAGAALFKSFGKNAAISSDKEISKNGNGLAVSIKTAIDEAAGTSYTGSKMFRRYLDSGRLFDDNADVNSTQNYNFKNTNIDFVVQLTGNVTDPDVGDVINGAFINRVLGDKSAGATKVGSDGAYMMNILVRMQQRNDL
mgnify:CR=1 FL=1